MRMNKQDEILARYGRTYAEHASSVEQIAALIDNIPDVDDLGKIIIRLRWGLTTVKRMTFEDMANLFGMPRERVEAIANETYECFAEGYKGDGA